jgi:integrase
MDGSDSSSLPSAAPLRYAARDFHFSLPDGRALTASFIVLKKGPLTIRFTGLERFVFAFPGGTISHFSASSRTPLVFITEFLNFLIEEYPSVPPAQVPFCFDTEDMQDFFSAYARGGRRTDATVLQCVSSVTRFAAGLADRYPGVMPFERDSLFRIVPFRTSRGASAVRSMPVFSVRTAGVVRDTFRDLPLKALALLLRLSYIYAPDILLALCFQAFAGLREGEVMSVRQQSGVYGPGLIITEQGGELTRVIIDISSDYVLRSDGIPTGTIKRTRKAEIFPAFLPVFRTAHALHLHYLAGISHDPLRAPMFIDSRGNAMTVHTYRRRVRDLVHGRLRPALLASADPELVSYGRLLTEHGFVPHQFRHAMSVALVLMGASIEVLQYYRGDRDPSVSMHYLSRKQDLVRVYRSAQDALMESLLSVFRKEEKDE